MVVVRTDEEEEFDDLIAKAIEKIEVENERDAVSTNVVESQNFTKDMEGAAEHCSKCNGTDLTYREGFSKTKTDKEGNPKKWKANVCQKCNNFNWVN